MAGDSHTNFNSGAFTAGAVGGALTIAGGIVAGAQNVLAARREMTIADLQALLDMSEALRGDQWDTIQSQRRRITELERRIQRMIDSPVIKQARAIAKANRL
jgi:hypothetical protein